MLNSVDFPEPDGPTGVVKAGNRDDAHVAGHHGARLLGR